MYPYLTSPFPLATERKVSAAQASPEWSTERHETMADARMISKVISMSEKLCDLAVEAQLLYTWMIPHADDLGLLQASAKTIKAQVMPMSGMTVTDIDSHLTAMRVAKLIIIVTHNDKRYIYISNFERFQKLRKDRNPQTLLELELLADAKQNWEKCEKLLAALLKSAETPEVDNQVTTNDSQLPTNGGHLTAELKRREEKRSELNNGNPAGPVGSKSHSVPIGQVVAERGPIQQKPGGGGITRSYQDAAFRHADGLGIKLKDKDKGRFIKIFKDEHAGIRHAWTTERAFTYLADSKKFLSLEYEIKLKYWFDAIMNGFDDV